jgi:hypothetical protein
MTKRRKVWTYRLDILLYLEAEEVAGEVLLKLGGVWRVESNLKQR